MGRRLAGPQPTPLITSAPIAVGSPWTRRALDQRKLSYPCRNFAHMFEGSGIGVGLTVNQLDVPGWPGAEVVPADPGWHPTRLGELMPVAARSGSHWPRRGGRTSPTVGCGRTASSSSWSWPTAAATIATARPAQGRRVTLWSGHDLAAGGRVRVLPGRGRHDHELLPRRGDDADRGGLDPEASAHRYVGGAGRRRAGWSRARAIAQEIGRHLPELDPHVVRAVEAVVLPQAVELSVGRLRSLVRTEVVRHDAEAADRRRRQAEAAADVFLRRSALDGMTEVVNVVPQAVAAAMYRTVDECARQAKADGDPRPIGQIRAEVSAAMTLRPWDDSRPPVTAELRVLAPLNSLLPDRPTPTPVADRPASPRWRADHRGAPACAAHRARRPVCPAGCRPPPAARCTWICSAPAGCSPPSRAGNSNRRYAAAARSTPRGTVGVRSWTGHHRQRATRRCPAPVGSRP